MVKGKKFQHIEQEFVNNYKKIDLVKKELSKLVFGQEEVIKQIIISILANGHALLVGLPGLAKTRMVNNLGLILGLDTKRVQFTPDLMPGDVIGTEILDENRQKEQKFIFIKGPVFSQLLLADEINRASPRTQSALLQSMQEKQVTVAGKNYDLPRPFHVLATQNPIDQEGTYPLPEAQLDRFLMNIKISYPDKDAEKKILLLSGDNIEKHPDTILSAKDLINIQDFIRKIPVGNDVLDHILQIVENTRPETTKFDSVRNSVLWGPSPRAAMALLAASKAKAFLENRASPSFFDIQSLIKPVLSHRMKLKLVAESDGVFLDKLLEDIFKI